ncbi:MAG: lipopolysaccharide export system protein LptC [Paraglaciecola sp.]|jgi:lipopolysaccharide export system protein LptC
MNRITISIAVLFILVLAVNLPSWMADEHIAPKEQTEAAWLPNYQASTMLSTLYHEDGTINHQVFAHKMEHFELLGFTLFKSPRYTIFLKAQEPWMVQASEGTLYEDNRIQFENDVEITRVDEEGFVQTIRTHFIEVDLSDKTLFSDQAVEITGQNYVINSNGLTANLETLKYELIDHVQTVYQPLP